MTGDRLRAPRGELRASRERLPDARGELRDAQDALLDRLFAAITAGDLETVADLYADDVEVWHNTSGRTLSRKSGLAVLGAFLARAGDVRYEVIERRHWESGAMQRHVLRVRVNGLDHAIDACITFAFADGRIKSVHEYVDGRTLAPLGW